MAGQNDFFRTKEKKRKEFGSRRKFVRRRERERKRSESAIYLGGESL